MSRVLHAEFLKRARALLSFLLWSFLKTDSPFMELFACNCGEAEAFLYVYFICVNRSELYVPIAQLAENDIISAKVMGLNRTY